MTDMPQTFQQLCDHAREIALLRSIDELLGWDERTMLPPAAGEYRAQQIRYLAGQIHARSTDPRIGQWLGELADSPWAKDPHSDPGATIRQLRRDYEKRVKLPQALVERLAELSVLGQQKWVEARREDDFQSFAPLLTEIFQLKREQAEAVGYDVCPYDALLDDFEPGEKTATVATALQGLREQLVPLVETIAASGRQPDREILTRHYPMDVQESFGKQAAAAIGFDFQRGRLDVTHHPFCAGIGPSDCRITTRYDERHFPGAFFGILHEAGHGIYEQGLRADQFGLPPGTATSLGIHESQSRMWENWVGRSPSFWKHFFPQARQVFPGALRNVASDDFYFAINEVTPSLIRVEADEATYNLHIILRFELEQGLLNNELTVADLPSAWNEKYRHYLSIDVPSDRDGVLQDVHWSAALIGYFPTYSLGNLYAAQLYEQAESDLGDLSQQFAEGKFDGLRHWLNQRVHHPGQCYSASELVHKITGKPLSHEALLRHLRGKLEPLYGVD